MAVDLDPFRKELIYRTRATSARVLQELAHLGQLDAENERKRAESSSWGCGTLIACSVCLLVALALMDGHGTAALLVFLLAVAFGVAAITFSSRKASYARLNLENRRYELVSHLMKLLRVDIAPEEPLALELDLRPDTHPQKFRGQTQTPTGWKVDHFLDPWLSLQGRLLDGTHFRVEMTERVERRNRTKSSRSGRIKNKTKRLSDAIARVQLRVKPERSPDLGRLGPRARGAVQLPKGTRLKSLGVEGDRLTLTVVIDAPWTFDGNWHDPVNAVRVLAMMFLSLYQVLNLSRVLDKKTARPSVG